MRDKSPLVSIVIPTQNSARTIEACLQSVRTQDYSPLELILVDNASTDDTMAIARRYCDVVDSFGPERSAQRNHGARRARGEYLLFLDSDMTMAPSVVSDCWAAIRLTGEEAVIIPEISVGQGFLANCRALERSCYEGDDSIEAARFFSAATFEAAGGFDETLVAFEDWDLSHRVAAGRHLPRTSSSIAHDEGVLRLRSVLAKKRYYGASARLYWRKHGRRSLMQANLVLRPAFLRNWRRLARHPLLTVGFLTLKSLESVAGAWGILDELLQPRESGDPNQPAT